MAKYKNLTQPDEHSYQVRIVRQGKEHSRYFSYNLWGDRQKALKAALNWRDQMLTLLEKIQYEKSGISQKPLASKKTTGIRGVSRSITYDSRRNYYYMEYQVHWRFEKKAKSRTFYVGNIENTTADQEFHAFRTAVFFRREFELCLLNKKPFEPEKYENWKQERIYEKSYLLKGI